MISDPKTAARIHIVINRNPSINFGSFITTKIVKIKPYINDKTLTLNTRVIKTLNADFDGDQINIFRIFGEYIGGKFEANMLPSANLYVDRINGHLNKDMCNSKDEVALYVDFMTRK